MKELISGFFGRNAGKSNATITVADRFKSIFNVHGVETNQIPRILPDIGLESLQANDCLLARLTPEILEKVAKIFGVRVEWLEGVDDRIYDRLFTYKTPEKLLKNISSSGAAKNSLFVFCVLTTSKLLNRSSDSWQELAPVVMEKITDLGETEIFRYHIYQDGYNWQHSTARIELKAIAEIFCRQTGGVVPLFEISRQEMECVLRGELVPRELLRGSWSTDPSLEDFTAVYADSPVAKEMDEHPEILKYIEDYNLQSFSFDYPKEPAHASLIRGATTAARPCIKHGKREANNQHWEAVKNAARGIWLESPHLSISDVVRKIKLMSDLYLSSKPEDTISRHISDLDPKKQLRKN